MITLFKGDDTGGLLGKSVVVEISTEFDLTGCTVIFNYQGIERRWENVHDGDSREVFFSHNETARMSVGTFKAVIIAVDAAGKVRTITNSLPIKVSTNLSECYGDNVAQVTIGATVNWERITGKPFEGQEIDIGTDDKVLAALGTIIEKLGGTVKAGIALVALCAMSAFGYTPETHDRSYTTNGITYAQRGGLGASDYVVTNIDAEAVGKVKSVNGKDGEVVLTASDVNALPDTYTPPVQPTDTNAVRDIAREEIVPATNRLNQTLTDAIDAKRDKTDLAVYGFTEWTFAPVLLNSYEIRYRDDLGKWGVYYNGSIAGTVKGSYDSLEISWDGNEWCGGYPFTATRSLIQKADTLATTNGVNAAIAESSVFIKTGGSEDDPPIRFSLNAPELMSFFDMRKTHLNHLNRISFDGSPEEIVFYDGTSTPKDLLQILDGKANHEDLAAKRDLADNTCHKTEFGEWSIPKSHETLLVEPQPKWNGVQGIEWIWSAGSYMYEATGTKDSTELDFYDPNPDVYDHFTSKRAAVCTDGKKFVTSDVVDGKVSSAVSTNNPAFVSAVRNTPAPEPGQGEDPPWGTWGTVGAAIAGLVAGLKWLKDKVFDSAGNIQDQFATDLLGKQVANAKVRYALATASSATMADRTVNILTMTQSETLTFPTATTHDNKTYARDFLLKLTYTAGTMELPQGVTKVGDELSFEAGKTYLIAFTEIESDKFYVRAIDITEAQA